MLNWVKRHKFWTFIILLSIVNFAMYEFGVGNAGEFTYILTFLIVFGLVFKTKRKKKKQEERNTRGICGGDAKFSGSTRIQCPECQSTNIGVAYGDRHECGDCGKIFT